MEAPNPYNVAEAMSAGHATPPVTIGGPASKLRELHVVLNEEAPSCSAAVRISLLTVREGFRTAPVSRRTNLDLLLLRLLLSFVIGGLWVTLITLATVKYGAKLGGLLAGFPSTVAFSLVFIGLTQSTQDAVEATTALPLALGFTASFPLVYAFIAKRARFSASLLGALAFWAVSTLAFSAVILRTGLDFWISVAGFYAITGVAYVLLAERGEAGVASHGVRPTAFQWVWRFLLAGGIIICAVFLSQTVGPLVGGVFSSFPAIITSTIYIITRVEGVEASRSIAVPVTVSTVFTIVPYVVAVRYAFPVLGVLEGTLVGYALAIPLSVAAFYLVARNTARR